MSTSHTIIYRQLGSNNDPIWGQGAASFLSDADAVAQAILTRLRLFEGEWWESTLEGTPLWQQILAVGGAASRQQQISLLLQQRILGTPYVTGISSIQVSFASGARAFSFTATVQTQFGQLTLDNMPQMFQALPLP